MVTARKPSVLTPKIPRASRAKPKPEPEVREWHPRPGAAHRCRILGESPFGGFERPLYSDDLTDVEIRQAELEAAGVEAVVEHAYPGGIWAAEQRKAVTIAELAQLHLAREGAGGGRWEILPEGQRMIYESMGLAPRA